MSIEVDPRLAKQTDATIEQARLLWRTVDRPNTMVKIPATLEGLPAITKAISEGISVNVTLIFSLDRYRAVANAYLDGLEQAQRAGIDLSTIRSVASFFVSRVDTEIDKRLDAIGTEEAAALKGKAGVANARLAFQAFEEIFSTPRWEELAAAGAHPQRPLWASTGVKDPAYPDTMYVDELVVDGVVNTMPEKTMKAAADHADLRGDTVHGTYDDARRRARRARAARASPTPTSPTCWRPRASRSSRRAGPSCSTPSPPPSTVRGRRSRSERTRRHGGVGGAGRRRPHRGHRHRRRRPRRRGPRARPGGRAGRQPARRPGPHPVGSGRRGRGARSAWAGRRCTRPPGRSSSGCAALRAELAAEGIDRVVLAGMGGSSLAPEVLAGTAGAQLTVLDSTDPDQVHRALEGDLRATVLVVSSKSGGPPWRPTPSGAPSRRRSPPPAWTRPVTSSSSPTRAPRSRRRRRPPATGRSSPPTRTWAAASRR